MKRILSGLATLLLCAFPVRAQDVFTYKTETHLINTAISVHDSAEGLVKGLTQEDFTIVEDGVPQTVRFFAHDGQLPLSIGLMIDASGSQEKFTKAHEKDINSFLVKVLEAKDEAFAVCFGNHLRLVRDFSSSPQSISDAIRDFDKGSRDFPEIGPEESRDLGTALYDAVYFGTVEKLLKRPESRKVLLIMSDGEENSSEHDLLDAIEAAQTANVVVYAIRYTEHKQDKLDARDRYGIRVLDHLVQQTGGKAYDVRSTELTKAFAEIAGELRSMYEIAYQSTNKNRDGLFRKVIIRPLRKDLVVRSRPGYYAR